jgi:ElaB/YqjD/DUF883 family membrane-anchored ribosome-binding protein
MTDATPPLEDIATDAADAAKTEVQGLAEKVEALNKVVAEQAAIAKEWAEKNAGVAKEWALDQSEVLRDNVQTRPFIAIGVSAASAFAAGLILGVLLTRRD